MIIPQKIFDVRNRYHLTQAELARRAHISINELELLESGDMDHPPPRILMAIEQVLRGEGYAPSAQTDPIPQAILEKSVVLLIDDNHTERTLYKHWLENTFGDTIIVLEAEHAQSGLIACARYQPIYIILDFEMLDMNGVQFIQSLKSKHTGTPPILLATQHRNTDLQQKAASLDCDYICKSDLTNQGLSQAIQPYIKEN